MTLKVPDFDTYAVTSKPVALAINDAVLNVTWDDGHISQLPFIWLREYSPDPGTHNPATREQNLTVNELPRHLSIEAADITVDGAIALTWQPENLRVTYHPGWLRAHCPQRPQPNYVLPERVLWTAANLGQPPTFKGSEIEHASEFSGFVEALHTHGMGLIRGLDVEETMLEAVVERIGPIRTSNFGRIFEVKLIPGSNSNAYTAQPLRAHTDLATHEYHPGLQFFFCMENSVDGGISVLTDGFAVAAKIREDHPAAYRFLTEVAVPFVNRDKDTEYRTEVPLLETDRAGNLTTVRFTYWLRDTMHGDVDTLNQYYEALSLYHHYADDEAFQIRVQLQPGDLLGIDNRRTLHGRTGFDERSGSRWLRGCYMEREEVESRLRILDRQRRAG